MVRVLGHRQTKGAVTDNPNLRSPRHISTLPSGAVVSRESVPSRTDRRQPKPEVPHVELTSSKLPLNSMPYLTSTVSA